MANHSIIRITKEIADIQRGPDYSLAVACRDIDVRHVRALIIGPPDTPYEFGFFEFNVKFDKEYPIKAPKVTATTTDGGQTRFNPNIYAGGKVCLSILGTWRGERGEEWSSSQCLESVLLSIQSLMSPNPYENEPGFEEPRRENDKRDQAAYKAKIRHETLRVSVIERLEDYLGIRQKKSIGSVTVYDAEEEYKSQAAVEEIPWEPFKDLIKRRFLWYYEPYMNSIEQEAKAHKDGSAFAKMPFEGPGNTMDGRFQYSSLKTRLEVIWDKLQEETMSWAEEGKRAVAQELGIASNLQRQFEQIVEFIKRSESATVDLNLVDQNPFVWELTLFGRPMSSLDGGMFRILIRLSPKFPEVLPRVHVDTPIFHHRVSPRGVLCYDAKRKDDMKSHVEAIIDAIEEESPAYDPRTLVNMEATALLWGSEQDKKMYRRKLRRSVQDSVDCL